MNDHTRDIRSARGGAIAAACLLGASSLLATNTASANSRHFTYTYETATLPQGAYEIEPWLTMRAGRRTGFLAFDYSLEFEGGITDRFQAALYMNATSQASGPSWSVASTLLGGALELKYRLLDTGIDPIGLALYAEAVAGPTLAEAEGKILIDRRVGNFLFSANLVWEQEWIFRGGEVIPCVEAQVDLAAAWFPTPQLSIGLEARSEHRFAIDPEWLWQSAPFYVGPTVSYSARTFWTSIGLCVQVAALQGASAPDVRDLDQREMVQLRFLVGL